MSAGSLGAVKARIANVGQLQEVVGAMRSLAAMRMGQAAETLAGARRYAGIVTAALGQALSLADGPPPTAAGRRAVLLFSAEHGFVGAYAEMLAEAVKADGQDLLLVVGTRGAQALAETGMTADRVLPMASHAGGLAEMAHRLAVIVSQWAAEGRFTRLQAVFARISDGNRRQIVRQALLPLERVGIGPPGPPPTPLIHLPAAQLVERLVEDYIHAELMLAGTEAMAAENAARLEAMTAAGDNIERKLAELQSRERILRQEQITEELLDLVNGAELLFSS